MHTDGFLPTDKLLSLYFSAQVAYLERPHALLMTDGDFDQLKATLCARADAGDPLKNDILAVLSTVGFAPKGAKVTRARWAMRSIPTDTRYTSMVGLVEHFLPMVAHAAQMGRMERTEPTDWVLPAKVICELKHDGLAVELRYERAKGCSVETGAGGYGGGVLILRSASLRGDGYVGEDVTNKVYQGVLNVPKWLTDTLGTGKDDALIVRGEAVMLVSELRRYNDAAVARGEKPMANARNAASGILRRSEAASVTLEFIGYDVFTLGAGDERRRPVRCQTDVTNWCIANDLAHPLTLKARPVHLPAVAHTVEAHQAKEWRDTLIFCRAELLWDIDGVVYKVDDLHLRDWMGETTDGPRGMLAHKLPPVEVQTTVMSIVNQVGRSGKITPVAKLKPVEVGGVEVSSVTLHNWGELKNKGVYVGAEVIIRRAGDVIPELAATLGNEAAGWTSTPPVSCPCCGDPLESNATGVERMCVNDVCSGRVSAGLLHWVSKKCMDIDGAGPELVEQWVRLASLSHPRTTLGMIPFLSVWADNVTQGGAAPTVNEVKVAKNIQASRTQELYRLLSALGIDRAGTEVAKAVSSVLPREGALRALMGMISSARSDYGTSITGSCATALLMKLFGDAEGQRLGALVAYRNFASAMVNSPEMRTLFDFLSVEYIPTNSLGISADAAAPLAGHTLVFTGAAAEGHSREDMQAMALRLGAKVVSSVTKKCTAAVIGVGAGKKADDAAKAKVEVWTPEHFMAMCQGFTAQTP